MASIEEVELVLEELLAKLADVDESTRALLPSRRTIEARCPDLDLVLFAEWQHGHITMLDGEPVRRPDIRISVRSDDLLRIASGELSFGRAFSSSLVRLDASMADLLRLRAAL